jgi:putative NIF3 family GTP cyclohydrolase 1 type 2
MTQISRREFVALTAAGTVAAPFVMSRTGAAQGMTAREIVDRITQSIGTGWKADSVDTFKAGDPTTRITGIATTSLATLAVLDRAVKAGANMVVTCEPTFYSRSDTPTPPAGRGSGTGAAGAVAPLPGAAPRPAPNADPVFAAKADFIEKHGLVIWRFSDNWRARRPDPFATGLLDAFGWSNAASTDDSPRARIAGISLRELVSNVKKQLGARGGIRVVGSADTMIGTVGVLPGSTPLKASLDLLSGVDAVIAGEVREWESVEYARDTIAAGGRKALVLVGRVLSESPGMNACAAWLKTNVPGVPATSIAAGDPYWSPRS